MGTLRLTWWLHACFELEYEGRRLLIDPHDGGSLGVGFKPPAVRGVDYVLVTHEHYDHNAVGVVEASQVVREGVGVFELPPFTVKGVRLPHDEFEGRIRGFVVVYRIQAGDISVLHLSDLGRPLTGEEAEQLKPVDIVLVPAGGVYTLHPRLALETALSLEPRLIIPMHYWLPGMQLPLEPLDVMLRYAKKIRVVRHDDNSVELSRETLPNEPVILVLAPPR